MKTEIVKDSAPFAPRTRSPVDDLSASAITDTGSDGCMTMVF